MTKPMAKHDAPECPKCKLGVGTPAATRDGGMEVRPHETPLLLDELWCPVCGHFWTGAVSDMVRAWWSLGAHCGTLEDERKRGVK